MKVLYTLAVSLLMSTGLFAMEEAVNLNLINCTLIFNNTKEVNPEDNLNILLDKIKLATF